VTPVVSVEAFHDTLTEVADAAFAVTLFGTEGGAVSTVQLAVAGVESVDPEAVAATLKVCDPAPRPE
jgi:hypothetical protein